MGSHREEEDFVFRAGFGATEEDEKKNYPLPFPTRGRGPIIHGDTVKGWTPRPRSRIPMAEWFGSVVGLGFFFDGDKKQLPFNFLIS